MLSTETYYKRYALVNARNCGGDVSVCV